MKTKCGTLLKYFPPIQFFDNRFTTIINLYDKNIERDALFNKFFLSNFLTMDLFIIVHDIMGQGNEPVQYRPAIIDVIAHLVYGITNCRLWVLAFLALERLSFLYTYR